MMRARFARKGAGDNMGKDFKDGMTHGLNNYDAALRKLAERESERKLDELLSKCTPENAHEEVDWGTPLIDVGFKRLSDEAIIPTKAHPTDSGFDLYASEDVIIEPGETTIVPTSIAVELPKGYEAQVRPRSGVTAKTKPRVQLGTIDNGYNGEIGVIVDNIRMERYSEILYGLDEKPIHEKSVEYPDVSGSYLIRKGDRIAQLVIQPLPAVEAYEVDVVEETERGADGFGSTGV